MRAEELAAAEAELEAAEGGLAQCHALARSEAEAEARLSADLTRMRAEVDAFLAAKGQKAKGPTKAPPSVGVLSAPNTARRPDSARKSSPKRAGKK